MANKDLITLYTASGSIPARYKSVEFIFSPDFTGTVSDVPFDGSVDYSLPFQGNNPSDIGVIRFTITTGSIRIKTI